MSNVTVSIVSQLVMSEYVFAFWNEDHIPENSLCGLIASDVTQSRNISVAA